MGPEFSELPPFEVLTGCKDLIEFPIALILFAQERRHLKCRFPQNLMQNEEPSH
jgi:hypothetical protein